MKIGDLKKLFVENRVKGFSIFIALVLVLGVLVYSISNKKTDLSESVKVEFSGYNGSGSLSYNSGDIEELAAEAALEYEGISKVTAKKIVSDGDLAYLDEDELSDKMYEKIFKAGELIENVSFDFDKTTDLSNGDKVTFVVKVDGDKSPIKATKRTFKVSGLKKSKTTTFKELLKDSPIKFTGYNGFGRVSESDKYIISGHTNKYLNNGDKVKVKLAPDYVYYSLESKGVNVKDKDSTVKVEVSGLKDIQDIKNIDEVFSKLEDYVKSDNKNESDDYHTVNYTIEPQDDFIMYNANSDSDSDYDDSTDDVNDSNNTDYGYSENEGQLNVARIYKITETLTKSEKSIIDPGKTTTTEWYSIYGYNGLDIYDNKLVLSNMSSKAYYDSSNYDDADSASSNLKSKDYVEYVKKS